MKSPSGDEENVVRQNRPMLGGDRAAFYNGEQIALHALSRDIRPHRPFSTGDFVDLVKKHNPCLLNLGNGLTNDVVHVDEFLRFFLREMFQSLRHFHKPLLFLALEHPTQHVPEIPF